MELTGDDPFGTAALRAAVLAAWRDSPTRLREDAASEADLVAAGYRDRLLTELAQNAADAAAKAGTAGALTVWLDGRALHIANTGAPLDITGVRALTALRASDKADESVGRFGVGFTAVRAVADEIEVRSRAGGVRFSLAATAATAGASAPERVAELAAVPVPVLRLAWPLSTAPIGGDTEVVLTLRAEVDPAALLAGFAAEAAELLLELPALAVLDIAGRRFARSERQAGPGLTELTITGGAEPRRWWEYRTARGRWLVPLRAGRPQPAAPDVLRAPTRSDEELSLPALLIADIPMQPDRRRLLPGVPLAEYAAGYANFAAALPPRDRLVLIPEPGFPLGEADAVLRAAVVRELRTHPWLPVVAVPDEFAAPAEGSTSAYAPSPTDSRVVDPWDLPEPEPSALHAAVPAQPGFATGPADSAALEAAPAGSAGPRTGSATAVPVPADSDAVWPGGDSAAGRQAPAQLPARTHVLPDLTPELADLLAGFTGPLVIPELSDTAAVRALATLDVPLLTQAGIAEHTSGLERPARWWHRLYAALEPYVTDPRTAEELGALAVPLADGRLVTGPRTVVLDEELTVVVPVHWSRLVHPEAAHPLLTRLGARQADALDLLTDPALRAALDEAPDDEDLVDAVLRLAELTTVPLPRWIGLLEVPDETGEPRPADELLLPDAPLRDVLVADAPFGTVAPAVVEGYGSTALRAVGVSWDFSVITEPDPTGPDHDLDDEDTWWDGLAEDPPLLAAVRDLDLVADEAWPRALTLLLDGDRTRPLLADRAGYTAWWLRTNARWHGTPLGLHRHPADPTFTGLLPVFDPPELAGRMDALRPVLADRTAVTPELASALLTALADPASTPLPAVIAGTHRLLAAAVAAETLDIEDVEPPERVRALSGAVLEPGAALVLDLPWFGFALPADRIVVGDPAQAEALATLLELPLASAAVTAEVLTPGRETEWESEPFATIASGLYALPEPRGALLLHDGDLRVRLTGALTAEASVPWWYDGAATHLRAPR
ncbi:sacsin N-terminal ATP-binding-like domain-containing protein [Nocardia sp. NPDC057353]|uniref:sacsin N-terminal ATP-binding-like domain-containing protein n=1 Tax=Nocardia sp. NPDC057353 TaxID=3346104 RepID=UPI0036406FA0